MAKKKTTKKTAKKTATKKTTKKVARKKAAPTILDPDTRLRLLKPRESFDELIEQVLRVWSEQKGFRVPNVTPARLRSALRKAEKTWAKEHAVRVKLEQKLRPLSDARMIAEDAAWRAVLDVHAAAKLYGRSRPEITEAFAFLANALASRTSAPEPEPSA